MRLTKTGGRVFRQSVKTYSITASSPEDFQRQAARLHVSLAPGSSGRMVIEGKRALGVCLVPLASLMLTPIAGDRWAQALAGAGATVTARGAWKNNAPDGAWDSFLDCDAYVDWQIPAPLGQTAQLRLGPVAIVVVAAAAVAVLVALGWAIGQISAVFHAVTETIETAGPAGKALLWALAGFAGLALFGAVKGQIPKRS